MWEILFPSAVFGLKLADLRLGCPDQCAGPPGPTSYSGIWRHTSVILKRMRNSEHVLIAFRIITSEQVYKLDRPGV
jgi:hypothetical protein